MIRLADIHKFHAEHVFVFLSRRHLYGQISQENCKIARKYIINIVQAGQLMPACSFTKKLFPRDVRTVLKTLQIAPKLVKTVVCPACFYLYPTNSVPSNCIFKAVKGAVVCNEPLFLSKHNYEGISDKGACHLQPYWLDSTKPLVTVDVP